MGVFSNKRLWIVAFLLVVVIAVFAIFIDWEQVYEQLRHTDKRYLVVSSVALLFGFVGFAVRWRILLSNMPGLSLTFHACNISNMINTLVPLRPGDAGRIIVIGREEENLSYAHITSSVVVERWIEQIMRLAAFGGAIVFGAGLKLSWGTLIGSIGFIGGSFLGMIWMVRRRDFVLEKFPQWLSRLPRVTEAGARKALSEFIEGLLTISSVKVLMLAFVWSILTWFAFWVFHYLVLESFGLEIDTSEKVALSLGALALVPPSASTLPGIYHLSMVVPLSLIGYDENMLTAYALVLNFLQLFWIVGLGVWGIARTGISLSQAFSPSKVEPV